MGGLSWRNSTYDFATWPIRYEDLAPHYDRMERMMGVSGSADQHPNVPDGVYQKPLKWNCAGYEVQKGCNKLDPKMFRMITARKALLTEPLQDKNPKNRPVCHYCGNCMRGCDTESKYTSANTAMPRALATGKCKLILYANAAEVVMSKDGKHATGVRYFDARTRRSYEVKAKHVVLACGAIESARLLFNSKSNHHSNGLANSSGLVGKNLFTHTSSSVQGYLKQLEGRETYNDDGTESSHAYIASFYYDKPNPNFPKGYHIIIDSGSRVSRSNPGFGNHIAGFGSSFKQAVRARSTGLVSLYSQNGMIPSAGKFMELDPTVKDIYGLAVPKIHYSQTSEDNAIHRDALEKIATIIEASGGVVTNVNEFNGVDSVHWVGTAKMGNDPKTSVLNTYLRTHDVDNLYLADGSGFIDFSEKNPTLTVMALASRCGDYLYEQLKRS